MQFYAMQVSECWPCKPPDNVPPADDDTVDAAVEVRKVCEPQLVWRTTTLNSDSVPLAVPENFEVRKGRHESFRAPSMNSRIVRLWCLWPLALCHNRLRNAFNSPVFPKVTAKEATPMTLMFLGTNICCVVSSGTDSARYCWEP